MKNKKILFFLKISSFFIFTGRAYQHLFWDAPYRSFFWDQGLLEPVIKFLFDVSWQCYVTNINTDYAIQYLIKSVGILYLICGMISLVINEQSKKWLINILKTGAVSLVFLSLLITKNKFYHLVMFFEHTIQFGIPIILIYYLKHKNNSVLIFNLKLFISLTFLCHGIYALGIFYPLPANFVTMTLNILPISENSSKTLLLIAGILDVVIAVGIFIPKLSRIVLLYAFFWGIITAFARIISGFNYDFSLNIIHQYLYLVIYRIPHGLIPLLVYLYINQNDYKKKAILKTTSLVQN